MGVCVRVCVWWREICSSSIPIVRFPNTLSEVNCVINGIRAFQQQKYRLQNQMLCNTLILLKSSSSDEKLTKTTPTSHPIS